MLRMYRHRSCASGPLRGIAVSALPAMSGKPLLIALVRLYFVQASLMRQRELRLPLAALARL